ncbi:hypothetical protein SprV_0301232300 [Sparganum proliferum]
MWLPSSSRSHQHHLRRPPTAGEVSGYADQPVLCHRGSDGSLQHGESRRVVEKNAKFRLSRVIHSDGASAPRRHGGEVTDNGAVSEAIAVTNEVNRDCVLAPTLVSLMFSATPMDAYRDERSGICIAYRTDGHLLNQRRMHFQSRVSETTVHELLFADDCALNATSEGACKEAWTSSSPPATTSA